MRALDGIMSRTSIGVICFAVWAWTGCDNDGSGGGPDARCDDVDMDGVTTCDGDCDDANPLATPGGNEICGDGADNNCDGSAEEGCTGGIGTFVSGLTGADTNPGTIAMPLQTIGAGMANASTIGGPQTVIVAEGTYAENVALVEGIDLQGGYECNTAACTWTRDPRLHVSRIENQSFEGVVAGPTITQATLVDGFRIVGRDGVPPGPPGSVGVMLAGGAPTIRNNQITGGNVSGGSFAADRSVGIALRETVDPAGALITGNEVSGGTGVELSAGIAIESYPQSTTALAMIRGNTIGGGSARRAIGLVSWSAAPGTTVTDNDISGGKAIGGASWGIQVGGELTIDGNRINVDQTLPGCTNTMGWCGGIQSMSSTTTIVNNIVFGLRTPLSVAVLLGEFEMPAGAVVLNGNYLNGGGGGPAPGGNRNESAAVVVTIGDCQTCGFNGFVGRIRNNILDGGSNLLRFGLRENPSLGKTMRAEALENNLFWFATATGIVTDVMVRQVDAGGVATDILRIDDVNMMTQPPATANITGDPLLDPATWHLAGGSPCHEAGVATEAPATDFEGDLRPVGNFEIGHDEMP
jgi:hypothetical protein